MILVFKFFFRTDRSIERVLLNHTENYVKLNLNFYESNMKNEPEHCGACQLRPHWSCLHRFVSVLAFSGLSKTKKLSF